LGCLPPSSAMNLTNVGQTNLEMHEHAIVRGLHSHIALPPSAVFNRWFNLGG
ncbi:hypothetical protein MKW92_031946, partial [Papaver armeniacum]